MPSARNASRNSRTMSRPNGVFVDFQSVSFESNRQKPSWCLAVSTAYFMPACFARRAHARASKSTGLNSSKNGLYCSSGISSTERTHSPRAGIAYSPQWMNMPNRSRRNHCIRSSYFARSNLYILIDPFASTLFFGAAFGEI